MFDSVRMKLTLWYTGVLALVLVLFCLGIYTLMGRKLSTRMDANLRTGIEGMNRLFIHEKDEGETDQYSARSVLRKSYFPRQAVAFYDAQENLLADKPLGEEVFARLPDSFTARTDNTIQFYTLPAAGAGGDDGLRVAAYRMTAPSMKSPCYVVITEPLSDLADDLELLRGILYVAVPAALALAGLGGWFLARKSLAPVVAMSESAHRIGAGNLDERLPVANPRDELGQLAATFNELLARLDDAFLQQRRFMADASHELRTPLSVMHTTAEVTLAGEKREESEYRDAVSMMGAQTRRMRRIVEDMFTLARADAGHHPLERTDFYLDELVEETARAASVLATHKGVRIEVTASAETPYRGDEGLLRQMLLNLLDNAIKYTPANGTVRVSLTSPDSTYQIEVADTGTGIPPQAQPHIFKRFYRVDKARSRNGAGDKGGAGLGLSIAQWIAEAHDGRLVLRHSDETGSIFVACLPASSRR